MEQNIISVKKRNVVPGGVFGSLERKLCDITIQMGNERKYKTCYLDEQQILEYLEKYEMYLNRRRNKFIAKNNEKNFEKRIRNNLKTSPFYILSFIVFMIANTTLVSEITGFLLFLVSIIVGASSFAMTNRPSLYMTQIEKGTLEQIENELLNCKNLKNEAVISVNNKEHDDLERLKILHDAEKRKNEIRNKARFDELTIRRMKIEEEIRKMVESYDIGKNPEYTSSRRR